MQPSALTSQNSAVVMIAVAVQRMIQAGVVPVTWLSLASHYQVSW